MIKPSRPTRWMAMIGLAMAATIVAGGGAAFAEPTGEIRGGGGKPAADVVPDEYIVALKAQAALPDEGPTIAGLTHTYGGSVIHTYNKALHGFSAKMSETAAKRLAADPAVAYVQPVHKFRLSDTQTNPPSWGLDRIDQSYLPLNNSYTYPNTASNVTAYVVDSGIQTANVDFGGRATVGADFVGDGRNGQDCFGHGTHVAGTIGGTAYGVAKAVNLVAVRVAACDGTITSDWLLQGLDWVAANAKHPSVVNMSLGGSQDDAVDQATQAIINEGIPVVVAAGNDDNFSCFYSPADVSAAITVGAVDQTDTRAGFSNYGACVDLFAPGVSITSDYYSASSNSATAVLSGTSMATPHVTGAVALMLSAQPTLTPAQVQQTLVLDTNKSRRILNIANQNPPTTGPPAGSWVSYGTPAVGAASRVTLASNSGRVDAFVASTASGHPILHSVFNGTTWSAWENLAGGTVGNPTAIWSSGDSLDLFVTGPDNAVYHRAFSLRSQNWGAWELLGGQKLAADIVAVAPEPGAIDVYALGTDGALWWKTYDVASGWFPWASMGAHTLGHNFSVVADPLTGGEYQFVQGTDGAVYSQYFDGAFIYGWTNLGGQVRNDVKAVATSDGQFDIFAVGADSAAWHRHFDRSSWGPWESLGGVVSGGGVEAAAGDARQVDLLVRGSDGTVFDRRYNGSSWAGWSQISTLFSNTVPNATSLLTYQLFVAYPLPGGNLNTELWS